MNFLPIAIRELQVTARRRMTYGLRSLCALNAACVTLGFLFVGFNGGLSASSAGQMTFWIVSSLGYAIAACMAVIATSDCISEERRDGTLGFLFLTDLKGYDIVLGKLARLSVPVYCLIAAFPAFGFTMLLGGVTIADLAKVALALLNAIFFFSALGLLLSTYCWNGRTAVSAGLAGLLIFSAHGRRGVGFRFLRREHGSLSADARGSVFGRVESGAGHNTQTEFLLVIGCQSRAGLAVHCSGQPPRHLDFFQRGAAAGGAATVGQRLESRHGPPLRQPGATAVAAHSSAGRVGGHDRPDRELDRPHKLV